jgi:competence protein ComEC
MGIKRLWIKAAVNGGQIIMRYPLPMVALLYVCGLLLGCYVDVGLPWLFSISVLVAALALVCDGFRLQLLAALVLLIGWTSITVDTATLANGDLRVVIGDRADYVTVRGKLCETPLIKSVERGGRIYWHTAAEMEVSSAEIDGQWQVANGRVSLSTPGVAPGFTGCAVEVSGVIQPPKGPAAPGQMDFKAYLRQQGIYYQFRCQTVDDWRIFERPGEKQATPPLQDRFRDWAQQTLSRGLPEDEAVRLLWAMVLGMRSALTQERSDSFVQSGTMHLFAISGLHIALIAGILVTVLRVAQAPRRICGFIVIPLLWFYTAAIGWQASAVRASIMMSIIVWGWALERPAHLLNSLAAAALLILVWDPRQLFQAGFQLSFLVVLGIGLLVPQFEQARTKLLHPDPLLPPELRPRWKRWLDTPLRFVTTSFATSLAAWLGSLPLIAYYFHIFSPVGLLANVIIVPLGGFALMSSLGSLACGAWCLPLTEIFNHSAWFFMRTTVFLSNWFASLPGAYFYVRPPALAEVVLYYTWLWGLLSGLFSGSRWKWLALALASALTVACVMRRVQLEDNVWITALPIRGGAVFVDWPGYARDLLVDCGSEATAGSVVKPFLRSQGVNGIGGVALTHGDVNNVGGIGIIQHTFNVDAILTSRARFRSPAYRAIVASLEQNPARWRKIQRGSAVFGWTVLHPGEEDNFSQADDSAIVLRGSVHGTRLLLLSNLGRLGQYKLLERGGDLSADILVAGLPDRSEALCESLIEIVRPRVIVIACAEYPATARPSRQLKERLERWNIPVLYTSESGAVRVELNRRGWKINAMYGEELTSSAF